MRRKERRDTCHSYEYRMVRGLLKTGATGNLREGKGNRSRLAVNQRPGLAAALPRVLLLIGKQSVQPRFTTIGRVAMNDSMLCRFIERRYQTANLLSIWFSRSADSFLKGTQPRPHATVLSGPGERFSRTLRSRLCVSHFI